MRRLHSITVVAVLLCCGIILMASIQRDLEIRETTESDKTIANIKGTLNSNDNIYNHKTPLHNAGNIMRRNDGTWSVLKADMCTKNDNFVLAHLRKPSKTPIFVYKPEIDKHVSASIISRGHYEGPWVDKVLGFLDKFPNAVFLDIGANVGMFSVTIAALGHRVVAIDCLDENIMRICASMKAGNLTENLTIVHNAVSDKHEKVTLGRYDGDVGGTFVKQGSQEGGKTVETILLDDLLNIFNFKQVVIKMDVEKLEDKVLRGAYKFFEHVRVEALLMEFIKHKHSESGRFIVEFLSQFGLEPEVPKKVKKDYSKWEINNILFKRT